LSADRCQVGEDLRINQFTSYMSNMSNSIPFQLHAFVSHSKMDVNLSDSWFEAVQRGTKKVEGRVKRSKWANVQIGDRWRVASQTGEILWVEVIDIRQYISFEDYIVNEGLRNTLPGITDLRTGVDLYEQYCGVGADKECGVVAFEIKAVH
jgi:ASC-1-like (ASCH) protein